MRVLLLSHYFSTHGGGVESVANQIAHRLACDYGFSVTWLAAGVDPLPASSSVQAEGLDAWNPLETKLGLPYPLLKPSGIAKLWRHVGQSDVLHIHECQYMHALLAAVFCRLKKKKYVVTQHVGDIEYRSRIKRLALKLLNRLGTRVVLDSAHEVLFVSARVASFFARQMRHPQTTRLVENGVDTNLFKPLGLEEQQQATLEFGGQQRQALVAFVGRFVEKKGLNLIEALARARPNVQFVLAGQGTIDPRSWSLANVTVAGVLDAQALVKLYNAAHLLCIPSFGEGFPLVVQEAMACGCPVMIDIRTASGANLAQWPVFAIDVLVSDAASVMLESLDRALSEQIETHRRRREDTAKLASARWNWDQCVTAHAASIKATRVTF